jgi:hypothetical protein
MVEQREKQLKKIKNAKDEGAIKQIIDTFILEMKKNSIEDFRLDIFIRKLAIALLMIEHKGLSDKECDNVKLAQKILINKIVHGNTLDVKKKIK